MSDIQVNLSKFRWLPGIPALGYGICPIIKAVWCLQRAITKCSVSHSNLFMKKIIGSVTLSFIVTMMSCTNKTEEQAKEVIIVPVSPVVVEKEVPEKSTTVTLDKNGVKVTTQKVDVRINPDKKN
jgi:hypothetical protein